MPNLLVRHYLSIISSFKFYMDFWSFTNIRRDFWPGLRVLSVDKPWCCTLPPFQSVSTQVRNFPVHCTASPGDKLPLGKSGKSRGIYNPAVEWYRKCLLCTAVERNRITLLSIDTKCNQAWEEHFQMKITF